MRIMMIAHIGETLGHLVRGLAIADELAKKGHEVEFAASDRARALLPSWEPRYMHHPVRWNWSHNSCMPDLAPSGFLRGVYESNCDLLQLLTNDPPDVLVGLPGLFSVQLARHLKIPHLSTLHGPYLSPVVRLQNPSGVEAAILSFTRRIFYGGCVDHTYAHLTATLGFPPMTYREYLETETIVVPQPGLDLEDLPNIQQFGFIRASFGPPIDSEDIDLAESCYITFGSGNPCDISSIVGVAASVFPRVIVTTGHKPLQMLPDGVIDRPFIASSSLAGRVSAVVSHGGIGTVGTFAEHGTPQLIIPTELDQATMAMHADRLGIASSCGLEDWATRPRLGRRLPRIDEGELTRQLRALRSKHVTRHKCSGAEEIASAIVRYSACSDGEPQLELPIEDNQKYPLGGSTVSL